MVQGNEMGGLYHLQVHNISRRGGTAKAASQHRSSKPQDARTASEYRNGEPIKSADRQTEPAAKSTYSLRIVSSFMMFPDATPDRLRNRHALWNEVEARDTRTNSRLAKDYDIALAYAWPQNLRERVVRQFVREQFLSRGIAAEVSFHKFGSSHAPNTKAWEKRAAEHTSKGTPFYEQANEPKDAITPYVLIVRKKDGSIKEYFEFQPHVHVMCPTRYMTEDGLGAKIEAPKGEYRRRWDASQLTALREQWARIANMHLPEREQISHLSLRAQGIEREPQKAMGMAATKLERQGQATERGAEVIRIRFRNELRQAFPGAADQQQRRVKMDTQTPEEFVGSTRKERQAAYNELEEKWQSRQRLGARWQRAADVSTDSLLHQAHQTLAQGRDHILTQQAAERKAAAQLDLNQQEEARRRSRGMTADPQLRHSIAVGETAGTNGDWVAKCMAAHGAASAAFLKEQDRYRRQLADPKISAADKQEIALRQQIEYLDYRGFTNKDLAKTYDLIGGKGHTDRAQELRDQMLKEGMLADSLKEKHASLLRGREMELDQKRAAGYEGPERRFTDQEFERKHAERVLFLRQHGGNSAQIHRHKAAHAEQRQVREEYGMQQRFERRAAAETIKPERAPGAVIQRGETGRQKENRDYRQTATGEGQGAKVSREREGVAGGEMTDQMRAFNSNERQHNRQTTMQRQKSQERERTAGE